METVLAILLFVVVFGINTLLWGTVGLGRWATERLTRSRRAGRHQVDAVHRRSTAGAVASRLRPVDVAVLIPAHNEEAVIENSLAAAAALLPKANIHVLSDGSTDDTTVIARDFGANVLELSPNRGKAGALLAGIRHFQIEQNYRVVLLLDADTRLAPDYFTTGLAEFDDPDVVAVAGQVECLLDPPPRTRVGRVLVAYRARVYAVVQLLVKYGQAARSANVVSIVPGFASMYRTDVLAHIDIAAPGLVIEDFNMTFEVHANRLGRIVFRPGVAVAYTQDPDTLHDYTRQLRRWALGFWQTARRHRLGAGKFRIALTLLVLELVSSSFLVVVMLPLTLFALYSMTLAESFGHPELMGYELVGTWGPWHALFGFLLPDVALTVFAAIALRRPAMIALAPIFPATRRAVDPDHHHQPGGAVVSYAHSPSIDTPRRSNSLRVSGRLRPITLDGSPSMPLTNQPPRPSRVKPPATPSGSPRAM